MDQNVTDTNIVDRMITLFDQYLNSNGNQYQTTVTRENLFCLASSTLNKHRCQRDTAKILLNQIDSQLSDW